jgi:hypothetical protein
VRRAGPSSHRPACCGSDATTLTLQRLGVRVELLSAAELTTRFPQFRLGSITRGVFEPESGVILARRAVPTVVQ